MKPNRYIDHDDSVLYYVRFLDNRQFFIPAHHDKEAIQKVRVYFEGRYHMREPVLSIVMKTVRVERTTIEWLG